MKVLEFERSNFQLPG